MADRELGIRLTAEDDATPTIEGVADAVEEVSDDATIRVDADADEALSNVERLDRELEDLTQDGRELRIEFRAQRLQQQIRTSLRQLERLEDPVEIEAETRNLERLQGELRELQQLAGQKYDIEINADPKRTARRTADDLEGVREKGEGLQSAIPAIRGFGDELGETAQSAGVASQAVADLGDFALIAGERFAASGSRFSSVATKLGTVLGAAGLAGAFAGIAVTIGQQALPAIRNFITGSEDAAKAQEELEEATRSVSEALAEGSRAQAVDAFLNSNSKLLDLASDLGVSARALTDDLFNYGNALEGLDVSNVESAAKVAEFAQELDKTKRTIVDQTNEIDYYNSIVRQYEDGTDAAADSTGDLADASRDSADASRSAADALREVAEAQERAVSARQSLIGANEALLRSQGELATAVQQTNDAFAAGDPEQQQLQVLNLASAFDAQASAAVRLAEQQALAAGQQFTLADGAKVYADNLFALVGTLDGPAKTALLGYIDTLDGVPDNLETQLGVTVEGDVDAARDIAAVADEERTSEIGTEAEGTKQTGAEIDAVADQPRTAYIDVRLRGLEAAQRQLNSLRSQSTAVGRSIENNLARWGRINGRGGVLE